MENKLSFEAYNIEILDTENGEIRILPSKERDGELPETYAPNQLADHLSSRYFNITLPVFYKTGARYRVIANQWAYNYIVRHPDIKKFPAIVITNKKIADEIKDLDDIHVGWLSRPSGTISSPKPQKKSHHQSSEDRDRAKRTGRLCPFCAGKLNKQGGSHSSKKTHNKMNSIVCENKNSTWIMCKFNEQLTNEEMAKFKKYNLRTGTWLTRLKGKQCGFCKDDLYLRTFHHSGNKSDREILCGKCLITGTPHYSLDEFKTNQAVKNGLSVKRLCETIIAADLKIESPQERLGLSWLSTILSMPNLYEALKDKKYSIPKQAKPLIDKVEKNWTLFPDNPDTEAQKHELVKLNRILIENIFPDSPKLFLKDGSICNYRSPDK